MAKIKNKLKQSEAIPYSSKAVTSDTENRSLLNDPFIHILLILFTGFIVYFNSASVPFIFDDYDCILKNPAIKDFSCFPDTRRVMGLSMVADIQNNVVLRPMAYFTFALNYALHEFDLFGYHLVNILLHIGSSMLVYCLFTQVLSCCSMSNNRSESDKGYLPNNCGYLPLFAALLFVSHPIQTQAVTYIVQRFVPLATFFYLAALVLYMQFRTASNFRWAFYALSLCATILAMESKEIAFTLPVVMTLLELMFLSGAFRQRLIQIIPFAATMVIIPLKLLSLTPSQDETVERATDAINLINFKGISSYDYLMTQFGVITTYLRLLFLPIGQNIDYERPLQKSFFTPEVLLPLLLLLTILGTALYLLYRSRKNSFYKIIAFGIFWFFITLSVESSVVPINDLVFEHRAYLPSVGFFIAALSSIGLACHRLTGHSLEESKVATYLLIVVLLGYSTATVFRNMVWKDPITFWSDVTQKSPHKARAFAWLGESYMEQVLSGVSPESVYKTNSSININDPRIDKAIAAFQKAHELRPQMAIYYIKMGDAYLIKKDHINAEAMFVKAAEIAPNEPWIFIYRGDLMKSSGNYEAAREKYLLAKEKQPQLPDPYIRLADLSILEGKTDQAIQELEYVMKIYPSNSTREKLEQLKRKN